MNAILNNKLVDLKDLRIGIDNRSFLYGDGLFETIIFKEKNIQYIDNHFSRISKGMEKLFMHIPDNFNISTIKSNIEQLLRENNFNNSARIKLQVWRKPGGLYTPQENEIEYLLTTQKFDMEPTKAKRVDFCQSVRLTKSTISRFKTCNSLPYIIANLERKERNLDDLIILDHNGYISECTSSNIFWLKGKNFFTPSLKTGCIAGVKRKNLVKEFKSKGYTIHKVKAHPKDLITAEKILTCNVTGVSPIKFIGDVEYTTDFSFSS